MGLDIRNMAGQRLILNLDQQLTIEQDAGWLKDDELPGAKSYPIRFPLLPNEAFLKNGYRPEAARPDMEVDVTARMSGVLYRRCVLEYRVVDGEGDGFLKIDSGEAWSKLRKLSLQDVLSEPISFGSTLVQTLGSRMGEIAAMRLGTFPFTFFPIRNEGFWEEGLNRDKLPGFVSQPYVNAWGKVGNGWGFLTDSNTVKGYPVSPQFFLSWVLEQIFARAGYRIDGDWLGDPEVQALVIINQTAMKPGRVGGVVDSFHVVNPGQHLPKMSVGDFLKAIRQRYGLLFSFNGTSQVATIRQYTKVVQSPAVDLTPFIVGKYGIDAPANRGFKVIDAVDSSDELYKDQKGDPINPIPLTIGSTSDAEEVRLNAGTTQLVYETSPLTIGTTAGSWTVATVRQPGNTVDPAYSVSERYPQPQRPGETTVTLPNEVSLRLVSYRGMTPASNGILYPLGTPDVRNGRQEIVGAQSSALDGRFGIWRQVLRQFFYFKDQTRPVTVPLDLPASVVAGLKLHEPIALKLENQARRTYLINKLQAESPGPSGLMECKLFALSIPDGVMLAGDADAPLVYLEWVVGPEVVAGFSRLTRSYMVKLWADAARTRPAVVTNLPVQVRQKRKVQYYKNSVQEPTRFGFSEQVITYLVNGSTMVLEPAYLVSLYYAYELVNGERVDGRVQSLQPDPGDGYNIIKA